MKNNKPLGLVLSLGIVLALFSGMAQANEAAAVSRTLNDWFGVLNGYLASVLFFDVMPGEAEFPFIVAWLVVGAVFLTVRMGFINLRMFRHACAASTRLPVSPVR